MIRIRNIDHLVLRVVDLEAMIKFYCGVLSTTSSSSLRLRRESGNTTPEQFLDFIRRDNAKWAKLIAERGILIEKTQ